MRRQPAMAALITLSVLMSATAMADCGPANALLSRVDNRSPHSDGGTCGRALELDGPSRWCHWNFDLRSVDATAQFDAFTARMNACDAAVRIEAAGPAVNHPDSYGLRQWNLNGRRIALSLKDKAALRATLVFLRVTGEP